MSLIDYFPSELGTPRPQQQEALQFAENAFNDGVKVVVIEAPVGSGKSGVAMALSRAFGGGIVAMPTVQLQDQYVREFKNTAPLLGRSRFPCLKTHPDALSSIPIIKRGEIPPRPPLDISCATAPCVNVTTRRRREIKAECEVDGGCPHQHSIDIAQRSETIVSNLHSLVYCVALNETIDTRNILIIDECHDLQDFMRDFLKVKFKIRRKVDKHEIKDLKTTKHWIEWLSRPEQTNLLTTRDQRESYAERLERLEKIGDAVFQTWSDEHDGSLWIELYPIFVAKACQSLLFNLADKIVLMSGTIYNKDLFLKPLGIDPSQAAFVRIASDFPVNNRPIVMPRRKTLDLSHKNWHNNFDQAIADIKHIMDYHKDSKGLIHTSSYRMSKEIYEALNDDRMMSHKSDNFAQQLARFKATELPRVFISPIISQGVDFKEDLARWQIIVRPAYASISDPYVKYLLDCNRWDIYNYKAAIVFGQETGRIVRSNTDEGTTYLLSSTFSNLIAKSNSLFPLWLKQGFVK